MFSPKRSRWPLYFYISDITNSMLENFRANVLKHLYSTSIDIMERGGKDLFKQSQKKPDINKDEKRREPQWWYFDRPTKKHYSYRRILLTQWDKWIRNRLPIFFSRKKCQQRHCQFMRLLSRAWNLMTERGQNFFALRQSADFLCGLHEVYSHIIASSDLFVCPRESSACHVI